MSLRAFLRSLPCRMGLRPHEWTFWSRLQDGHRPGLFEPTPNVLIVERCRHRPWCRAVRSFDYQSMVPASFVSVLMDQLTAPGPYRALLRGTAVTGQPVPEATPEAYTPLRDRSYVPGLGEVEWSRSGPEIVRFGSRSSTATAGRMPTSSTSTPTPSSGSDRSVGES